MNMYMEEAINQARKYEKSHGGPFSAILYVKVRSLHLIITESLKTMMLHVMQRFL